MSLWYTWNGFMLLHFFFFVIDIIKVPQRSGFTKKNVEKLTFGPCRLYLIQTCISGIPAVQYSRVSRVLNANFNVPPSHMLWKMESAAVMLRLLSNPQLNKRGGHLHVRDTLQGDPPPSLSSRWPRVPLRCKREFNLPRSRRPYAAAPVSESAIFFSNSWSSELSEMKRCKIFEGIVSKEQTDIRSKSRFLTDEYNKSSQQTETDLSKK